MQLVYIAIFYDYCNFHIFLILKVIFICEFSAKIANLGFIHSNKNHAVPVQIDRLQSTIFGYPRPFSHTVSYLGVGKVTELLLIILHL